MTKWTFVIFLVATAFLIGNQVTHATVLTYDFTLEFSGATEPEGTLPWLTATVDDETDPGLVTLTLDSSGLTDGEYVDSWYFNINPELDANDVAAGSTTDTTDTLLTAFGHSNDSWQADGDSGGLYDFYCDFTNSNSGGGRFVAGETFSVTFNYAGLSAYDFAFGNTGSTKGGPFIMAAHVGGIGPEDEESGWIAATAVPVPEPATIFLLGSGLIGIAGVARKRIKK